MNRDPDERAHPEGGRVPDEFDAIVAAWRSEGQVPVWPVDESAADMPSPDPPRPDGSAVGGSGDGSVASGPTPDGPTPGGTAPNGPTPGGTAPNGPTPGGTAPGGTAGDGPHPGAPLPDRRLPDPALPDSWRSRRPDLLPPDPLRPDPPPSPVRPYPVPPADEDHFVPPEPPPLPRLGPPVVVGLVLIGLGLVLLVAPNWVGVPNLYGLPLGLVGLTAGLGWLLLRLWPDSPSGDGNDDDDGAVV